MKFEEFYMKNHKKLLVIPILILLLSIAFLVFQLSTKGYLIDQDVSIKGGISTTIYTSEPINKLELENQLRKEFPNSDFSIRELSSFGSNEKGLIIDVTGITGKQIKEFIDNNLQATDVSIQEMGEGLGTSFLKEIITSMLIAFVLISIVVFLAFRKFIPSIAIILSLILDLTAAFAIISLMGVKISSAGIAAFLMVMGYSIDTDILLTTRLLKRSVGTTYERLKGAFKTGILMTLTAIIALGIGFVITNSIVLKQMFGIILIALFIDIISTWIMNSSILISYINRKEKIKKDETNKNP